MSMVEEMINAVKGRELATVEAMINQDPSLANARTETGDSPVLIAAYYGAKDIVQLLLARGANLNLFEAAAVGNASRVREILTADPSLVNTYAHDGFQPLGLAAYFGHAEIVQDLIAKGAEVNSASQNPLGVMPLHSATARRDFETTKLLLNAGADVNATQERGFTPIHQAAHHGDIDLLELLISRGAHLNPRKDDGLTPLGLALKQGHEKAAAYLREQGAAE